MRSARIPLILLLIACGTAEAAHAAPARAQAARTPAAAAKKAAATAAARAIAVAISEQAHGQVKRFYATRGFWPLWASSGRIGPAADDLLTILATADLDGLDADDYKVAELKERIATARTGSPEDIARAELALSHAFADYVADVRRPTDIGMTYVEPELKPLRPRADTVLRAASLPASLRDYLTSMGWMSPQYVRLRKLAADALAGTGDEQARLRLNLDRARQLPGPWVRHIIVDAAAGRLFYYEGGKQQGTMRVVVGTPATPTPMLAGTVRYAILNPYWNVPSDLAQKRIAPKMLAGASLDAMGFEALSDWSPEATKLDPATIDWQAVADGRQEVRLRQLPGGDNAMGQVKFMFPNELGIYLHDTPDRALLAKPDRHFSNGCVRLEDAPRLGRWLLGKPLGKVAKQPEQDVALAQPVPIYLTYFTATPTEHGLGFLDDVYGRDKQGGD